MEANVCRAALSFLRSFVRDGAALARVASSRLYMYYTCMCIYIYICIYTHTCIYNVCMFEPLSPNSQMMSCFEALLGGAAPAARPGAPAQAAAGRAPAGRVYMIEMCIIIIIIMICMYVCMYVSMYLSIYLYIYIYIYVYIHTYIHT